MMTLLMMMGVSSVLGKGYILQCGSEQVFGNLYGLVVAPAAGGKSSAYELAFPPIEAAVQQSIESQRKRRLEIETEIRRLKRKKANLEALSRNEAGDGGAEDHDPEITLIDSEIAELKRGSYYNGSFIFSDPTAAGLKKELEFSPDNSAALVTSDARHLIATLSKDGASASALSNVLLECYKGDPISISRGTGQRALPISNARLMVALLAQTDIVWKMLQRPEHFGSGLASRFLMILAQAPAGPPREINASAKVMWAETIARIYANRGKPGKPVAVGTSKAAMDLLEACESLYRERASKADVKLSGFWMRAGENLRRLCLNRVLMESDKVETGVTEVIVLACHYFVLRAAQSLITCVKLATEAEAETREVVQLRRALAKAGGALLLTEVWKHGTTRDKANAIAAELPHVFGIRGRKSGGRGQPKKEIFLVETAKNESAEDNSEAA